MPAFNLDEYVQVNERIELFYQKYPEGSIQTEIIYNQDGQIIFKAYAYRTPDDTRPATGHAMEKEGSSYINKTSHIENCETSAVGRALAMLGFEIKKSVASREEVANALHQQESVKENNQLKQLLKSIRMEQKKKGISDEDLHSLMIAETGKKNSTDMTVEDAQKLYVKIKSIKGESK